MIGWTAPLSVSRRSYFFEARRGFMCSFFHLLRVSRSLSSASFQFFPFDLSFLLSSRPWSPSQHNLIPGRVSKAVFDSSKALIEIEDTPSTASDSLQSSPSFSRAFFYLHILLFCSRHLRRNTQSLVLCSMTRSEVWSQALSMVVVERTSKSSSSFPSTLSISLNHWPGDCFIILALRSQRQLNLFSGNILSLPFPMKFVLLTKNSLL